MVTGQRDDYVRPEEAAQPEELEVYFALTEAVRLLQHAIEQQLRTEGDLSYIQFQLLARLAESAEALTMTDLADGVVYSRSGLTYQAALLEQAGLITRTPSPDDERSTLVTLTRAGRSRFAHVLPGHVQVARQMLFAPLSAQDLHDLAGLMTRVRDHMRRQPPRSAAPRRAQTADEAAAS